MKLKFKEPQHQADEQLWNAASEGNLQLVKQILKIPNIDVNWQDGEQKRTSLYRACGHGYLDIVNVLLEDPKIDVNRPQWHGATPLFIAAKQAHHNVVLRLMADYRIKINFSKFNGVTPFYAAVQNNSDAVAISLLNYGFPLPNGDRVDVNKGTSDGATPLFLAAQKGKETLVRWILACAQELEPQVRWMRNYSTPADQAARAGYSQLAKLIEEYVQNPTLVRQQLRKELGINKVYSAHVFATLVLLSDNYLEIDERLPSTNHKIRFFKISRKLPIELQMVVCNRLFDSVSPLVLRAHSEPEFKRVLAYFCCSLV